LYHKRLAIIDPEGGHQPMTCGPLTLVCNGELYNYCELKAELSGRGHEFHTHSDTEVILKLYAEYGDRAFARMNGMFALLLHDRERHRLIAARDHFGVKPLYLHNASGRWLFASEIKALLAHPDVNATPDLDSIHDYLTFQFVLGEATMFRGIRKVAPGSFLVIDERTGRPREVQYWTPCFAVRERSSEREVVAEVRTLIDDAVAQQARSDVPIGSYLSGGLDSSIVTTLAARHRPDLRAFTGVFEDGPQFNESAYARSVAQSSGVELCEVRPTEEEFIAALPRLIYHMDEPSAGPGLFPQYAVAHRASQHVKVMLGGQGGDEIFGGYARYLVAYLEQALKGAIYDTNDEGEHIVSLTSITSNLPYLRDYVPLLQHFWRDDLFEPMDRRYFRLIDRSGGVRELLSEDVVAGFDAAAVFARFQQVFNHPDTTSYFNKMTHFDMVTSLPALLQVEDRVSMACSIESRVPLLDPRIADLVSTLPPRMKFKGGELKYLLRRAAGDVLPASVFARKDKMGFPVPLQKWLRGQTAEFVRDTFSSQAARSRGWYNGAAIERALSDEPAFGRRIWGLLCLELWFQRFIDAP
ncbi:MAG: asparagine synthase (glutamine-hydrolyzing), partial [Gemmatimonadaceae bacterium]